MGYQVIELESIDSLIQDNSSLEIQISILLLLIEQVKKVLPKEISEIALIKVEYLGAYPAIGLEYSARDTVDLEQFMMEKCENLLESISIKHLIEFMNANRAVIQEKLSNFAAPRS